jgi:hypothetical protein
MQFNNLVACSTYANQRINEFSFTMNYQDYIVLPKSVSLAKCVIPNTMMSFRANQRSLFIVFLGATYEVVIPQAYYDNLAEFTPMVTNALQEAISNEFTCTYNVAYEALQITNTANHPFTILPYSYSPKCVNKRLGFIENVGYASFTENSTAVVRGTGACRLVRTTGFFIASNLIPFNNFTCGPNNVNNIVDFVPIELGNLAFGDSIVIINNNLPVNKVKLPQNDMYNATSQLTFQILDDEFQSIEDPDRGQNTILFFNLDYD